MKIRALTFLSGILVVMNLSGQAGDNFVTKTLLNAYSERGYVSLPVTDQQLELVLQCGMKAPSAMNRQPWRFTVIRNEEVMKEIVKDALPGNAIIIISGQVSETGTTPDFDCGLAAESMFVAAHGLSLAARIYGSPVANITANRDHYQIPTGFKPVIVLRVGNADKSVDAVTAATPRKTGEEVVNYFR